MGRVKVLYDYMVFLHQNYGGVSRYFVGLMREMKLVKSILPVIYSENKYLNEIPTVHPRKLPLFLPFGRRTFADIINGIYFLYHLFRSQYDVFHPTETDARFFLLQKKPVVITVHDMIFELMSDDGFPNCKKKHVDNTIKNKKKLIEKSNHIIAISQNTKNDILKIYPHISEDKITVIYHGCVMGTVARESKSDRLIKNNYILYVGGRDGYKNFQRMLKAIASLFCSYPDLKLVCTGDFFSEKEKDLIKDLQLYNSVIHVLVDDNDMGNLYSNATMFVCPSLYEGFGAPILEAFYYGTPACLSRASCFPEIAEDAAAYFNPNDEQEMKSVIENLLNDGNLRKELVCRGKERLKFFSMDRMIKETEYVYKLVIENA